MSPNRPHAGYAPYTPDFSAPGDRRRFVFYARHRGVPFSCAAPGKPFDVICVSAAADIVAWSRHPPGGGRIVYDLVDSYLALPRRSPKNYGRGTAKWLARQTSRPVLDWRRAVEAMCRRADAVVCSTDEQREAILRFCDNVHVILDDHAELAHPPKDRFSIGERLNLVWEGLPYTLGALGQLDVPLRAIAARRAMTVHVITDLRFRRYATRFGRRETLKTLESILRVPVKLYAWDLETMPAIATACDIAILPAAIEDPFSRGKPENRLLLFWRLGLPVIASATPAYERAMLRAGIEGMACRTAADWCAALDRLTASEALRRRLSAQGHTLVEREHGSERLAQRWDAVFESVGVPLADGGADRRGIRS